MTRWRVSMDDCRKYLGTPKYSRKGGRGSSQGSTSVDLVHLQMCRSFSIVGQLGCQTLSCIRSVCPKSNPVTFFAFEEAVRRGSKQGMTRPEQSDPNVSSLPSSKPSLAA